MAEQKAAIVAGELGGWRAGQPNRASPRSDAAASVRLASAGASRGRRTDRRLAFCAGVKHPARQHDDNAGDGFDVAQPSTGSCLAVMQRNPSAVQRMPAIMNLEVVPNTGSMNMRWRSAESHGCLRDQSAGPNGPPSCTPTDTPGMRCRLSPTADVPSHTSRAAMGRYCCKSLFGVLIENSWSRWCVLCAAM